MPRYADSSDASKKVLSYQIRSIIMMNDKFDNIIYWNIKAEPIALSLDPLYLQNYRNLSKVLIDLIRTQTPFSVYEDLI